MKPNILHSIALALAVSAVASTAMSAEVPCDKIAGDVRTAVAKDPSKVLMVVEDALVINESCACEIVKAAILASSADAALTKQIVETAVAVAPKMTAVVQECAASTQSAETVAAAEPTDSGKSVVSGKSPVSGKSGAGTGLDENGNPFTVQPPKDGSGSDEDFSQGGRIDIRGVYLSQPAAGGFIVAGDRSSSETTEKRVINRPRIIRERRVVVVPISPTAPHPKS
jgi:hypothetical protein